MSELEETIDLACEAPILIEEWGTMFLSISFSFKVSSAIMMGEMLRFGNRTIRIEELRFPSVPSPRSPLPSFSGKERAGAGGLILFFAIARRKPRAETEPDESDDAGAPLEEADDAFELLDPLLGLVWGVNPRLVELR